MLVDLPSRYSDSDDVLAVHVINESLVTGSRFTVGIKFELFIGKLIQVQHEKCCYSCYSTTKRVSYQHYLVLWLQS